jgi:hypothetical protein
MQQQGEAYPQQQPPQQTYSEPSVSYYYSLILIGIILMLVAGILLGVRQILSGGTLYDISEMLRIMINEVGAGLFALGMLIGAFKDRELNIYFKVAMIIAMALVLAFVHY